MSERKGGPRVRVLLADDHRIVREGLGALLEKHGDMLLVEGKSTKRTAKILDVGVKTVETHRMHMMDKLNMRSIAELTKYAIREGLTPP